MGLTRDAADWVARASIDEAPAAVLDAGKSAIIDTVAVILAGAGEPVTRIVADAVAEEGASPVADRLGARLRTSMEGAAFVNGVSGHALDYDDVSPSVIGHPSVVMLPAALAAAQGTGASGRRLLEAYVIGVEVMTKLGRAMGNAHYRVGWHATSTLGTLGAAMAAGKLMGLSPEALQHALAIAVSEASGSRQNFGTMTKPFHPGHAARCGVLAARLARKGMTGDTTILEAPLGYFAMFSHGEAAIDGIRETLGNPYDVVSPGMNVKRYPCCYATHRAADAVLDLAREHELRGADVEGAEVVVPPGGLAAVTRDRPRTGLEGKFSLPYVVAAAVLDGRVALDTFTDEMVQRPEAQALLRAVRPIEDPGIPVEFNAIEEGYVVVKIRRRGGAILEKRVDYPRGAHQNPLAAGELHAKFRDCARQVLPRVQADRALALLASLEDLPRLDDLVAALIPAGAP
ncbi:MAG TPA: MmgE/PrpD family protein [bacterium]|nr:MmgE/PrpD family protein [bacterium]